MHVMGNQRAGTKSEISDKEIFDKYGPNWKGFFNPLIRNIRTGAIFTHPHHCPKCKHGPPTRRCYKHFHLVYCLALVPDKGTKDAPLKDNHKKKNIPGKHDNKKKDVPLKHDKKKDVPSKDDTKKQDGPAKDDSWVICGERFPLNSSGCSNHLYHNGYNQMFKRGDSQS